MATSKNDEQQPSEAHAELMHYFRSRAGSTPCPPAARCPICAERQASDGAWLILCRVSGGVTGTREAFAKDRDGRLEVFASEAEAEARAAHYRATMGRHSLASFRYTAVPAPANFRQEG